MQLHEATQSTLTFHEARKAREARIKQAAARVTPKPQLVAYDKPKLVLVAPDPDVEWVNRARAVPLPKTATKAKAIIQRTFPSIPTIQEIVARHYGVTRHDMISQRRTADVIKPRFVAVYLTKELTPFSYPYIGRDFGDRDHTTMLSAIRKIARLIQVDADLAHDVAHLTLACKATIE